MSTTTSSNKEPKPCGSLPKGQGPAWDDTAEWQEAKEAAFWAARSTLGAAFLTLIEADPNFWDSEMGEGLRNRIDAILQRQFHEMERTMKGIIKNTRTAWRAQ